MTPLDAVISAVLDAVRKSGLLTAGCLMGTVSVVGGDGTVTVTRVGDTYPKCRRLAAYSSPAVGDKVQIMHTAGGWICLGKLA